MQYLCRVLIKVNFFRAGLNLFRCLVNLFRNRVKSIRFLRLRFSIRVNLFQFQSPFTFHTFNSHFPDGRPTVARQSPDGQTTVSHLSSGGHSKVESATTPLEKDIHRQEKGARLDAPFSIVFVRFCYLTNRPVESYVRPSRMIYITPFSSTLTAGCLVSTASTSVPISFCSQSAV